MPHIDAHAPGSFCWFELSTTDQAAAKQFYTQLFGWDVTEFPMGPDETYTIFRNGTGDTGAAYTMRAEERQHGVPPHWMVYVAVANADEAAARVAALGGTVLAPAFDVMQMGRMAVVTDPAGTHFSLWQAGSSIGTTVTGEHGAVDWVEISVPDRSKVMPFYQDLFGWKIVAGKDRTPATAADDYPHVLHGDEFVAGLPGPEQRDPSSPPHMLTYFSVADVAASTKKAVSLGAQAFVDSMDIGENGRISVLADPQGAMFALHQAPANPAS
jgi:predicted enzyme related to lactoylglutathione lyase